jgi:hypothetical protein
MRGIFVYIEDKEGELALFQSWSIAQFDSLSMHAS